MAKNKATEEFRVVDEYELEREDDAKTIYSTFGPKASAGIIAFICILLDILKALNDFKHLNILTFVTNRIDWILVNIPVIIFIILLIVLRSCPTDAWVVSYARSTIGSTFMKVRIKTLLLNFDPKNTNKEINKFVADITDRSDLYNYFIKKIDHSGRRLILKTRKKVEIPTKAIFDKSAEAAEKWNYIPLGKTLTDKSTVGSINWMLNDEEPVGGDCKETIPSTSYLVAGGTGSGKSVVENNIIRHVNKYGDKIQGVLVDVKRVEFGNLSNLKGVNVVATDIDEAKFSLESIKDIMYDRFKFMEGEDVNNIYKIKNYKCDYFIFDAGNTQKKVQFDEILYCKLEGAPYISTADKVYEKIKNGDEIFIYFDGQKSPPVICNPKNDYCFIGLDVYKFDDLVTTREGKIPARDIISRISRGETIRV